MIMDIFRRLNRELGVTIVIVTHDMTLASKVDRVVAIRDGMTSTEFIKRNPNLNQSEAEAQTAAGKSTIHDVHEEYVVLDRAGRLQIPRTYLQALGIEGKASMEFDGEKIIIRPPKALG